MRVIKQEPNQMDLEADSLHDKDVAKTDMTQLFGELKNHQIKLDSIILYDMYGAYTKMLFDFVDDLDYFVNIIIISKYSDVSEVSDIVATYLKGNAPQFKVMSSLVADTDHKKHYVVAHIMKIDANRIFRVSYNKDTFEEEITKDINNIAKDIVLDLFANIEYGFQVKKKIRLMPKNKP